MPFTGQLGGLNSRLGNISLGGPGQATPFPFGFTPHVLDAISIRVLFNNEVDDSALNVSYYSMLVVSGPVPTPIPIVTSVKFYDSDQRSVVLTVSQPLTYTAIYALSVIGVTSPDGTSVTSNSNNFRANVPDPPVALAAFQSLRGMIDIYFDRPVATTSPGAFATIEASNSGIPQNLTLIPWNISIPSNVIRFELNPLMDSSSSYVINY